jgi:UV DNA damage repair endonuclease
MLAVSNMIRKRGFSVFVPALDVLIGFLDGKMDYEDYFENNIEWLKVADYMLVLPGWEQSSGTQKEMEIAESHNIPIFFDLFSLVVRKERDEKRNAELLDGVLRLHAESRKP